MQKRQLGRTDIDVSILCLGTMMYGEQIGETEAFEQMDASVDRGVNFFDTAEMYTIPPKPETQGDSERIIGKWLKTQRHRDKIVLASKISGRSRMTWIRDGESPRLTRAQILNACDASLERLQTDYIDLYQLHWPDRTVPVFGGDLYGYQHYNDDYVSFEETLSALDELIKVGKVRHVGLSNETPYGTMKFLELAERSGLPRMVSIQNAYNLVNRSFEYGLAEIAMAENIGLLAYSPNGQGALTGKYLDGKSPAGARGTLFGRFSRYETPNADNAIRAYVSLAHDLGVEPAALAMQFVTTRPWVTTNMFGVSSMDQLNTVFQSLEINWTDDLNNAVNEIHVRYPSPCP